MRFGIRGTFALIALLALAPGCMKGQLLNPQNAMSPSVQTVVPNIGAMAGGTAVAVHGSGFVEGASVKLGASACVQVQWINASQLDCVTPEARAGAVDVIVVNPNEIASTLHDGFAYVDAAPAVPGEAFAAGGSVNAHSANRLQIVTVGELGTPLLQSTNRRIATVGIQGVILSGN